MQYSYVPCKESNYTKGRDGNKIKYIVIHYTANDGDTARSNADYFARATIEASAHYFVDEHNVVQSVPDGDTAWHCGAKVYAHSECRNCNSIGVELCSRIGDDGYYFLPETEKTAAELVKRLMLTYGIPSDNVIRHYDVTRKVCPAPYVLDENKWLSFKALLTDKEKTKSDEINDFVWELAEKKIITNKALWLDKAESDINVYWLLKKIIGFLREQDIG